VQFLYRVTLDMPWGKECFPRVLRPDKLPVVLSPEEVSRFLEHFGCLKHRAARMLCYGAGLRISEAVAVKVGDIDSQRQLISIVQDKGKKDRYVMLSPRLLAVLRAHYRAERPQEHLFPTWRRGHHMISSPLSFACRNAAKNSAIPKRITANTLRHSFERDVQPMTAA
jgi:integrase/recombinase XerD